MAMIYETFLADTKSLLGCDDEVAITWITGGMAGGSCYGGDMYEVSESQEPKFQVLRDILREVAPEITFLDYDAIESGAVFTEETHREYYGNWTQESKRAIGLRTLYDELIARGYLQGGGGMPEPKAKPITREELYKTLAARHYFMKHDGARITMIAGLPGSGKTHLAKDLARLTEATLFDDVVAGDLASLQAKLAAGVDCIITDPHLCLAVNQQHCTVLFGQYEQEWIFFANNPAQCQANTVSRSDGRKTTRLIWEYTARYNIPAATAVVAVWQTPAK